MWYGAIMEFTALGFEHDLDVVPPLNATTKTSVQWSCQHCQQSFEASYRQVKRWGGCPHCNRIKGYAPVVKQQEQRFGYYRRIHREVLVKLAATYGATVQAVAGRGVHLVGSDEVLARVAEAYTRLKGVIKGLWDGSPLTAADVLKSPI